MRRRALVFRGVVVPISSWKRLLEYTALLLMDMFENRVAMTEVGLTMHHPTAALYYNPFVYQRINFIRLCPRRHRIQSPNSTRFAGRRRSGGYVAS